MLTSYNQAISKEVSNYFRLSFLSELHERFNPASSTMPSEEWKQRTLRVLAKDEWQI